MTSSSDLEVFYKLLNLSLGGSPFGLWVLWFVFFGLFFFGFVFCWACGFFPSGLGLLGCFGVALSGYGFFGLVWGFGLVSFFGFSVGSLEFVWVVSLCLSFLFVCLAFCFWMGIVFPLIVSFVQGLSSTIGCCLIPLHC